MDVLVTCERRLMRTPDGTVWTDSTDDAQFLGRYLAVFNSLTVLARVRDVTEAQPHWRHSTAPGIGVLPLPSFVGPVEFILRQLDIRRTCHEALERPCAVILRTPGNVALSLFGVLERDGRPYGVEVVGDPYDVFAPGAVRHPLRPLLRRLFVRSLKRQCQNATTASYVTERTLQKRYPPGPKTFSTHYSSVSLPREAFAQEAKSAPTTGVPLTVVSVGSMEMPYKGLDILIRAVLSCRQQGYPLKLLIIGAGARLEDLRQLARPLGDDVVFTGQLAGAHLVRKAMAGADLFVLPSMTEGLPRAMIEAMALGLPCIGTRVGGIPELLPGEDLVAPGDVDALAGKLLEVCREPGRLRRGAERNLRKAADYGHEILTRTRNEMYAMLDQASATHFMRHDRHRG